MSGLRYDRILAGTALALILAMPTGSFAETPAAVLDSAVPMPESATLPPPTITDVTGQPETKASESAPAPAVAPDPLAALDPADRPIAEKMRDLLAAKAEKTFTDKKQHAAVETFYQNRNLAPLWLDKGVVNARATAVIARLKGADADGLDPNDYKIPDLAANTPEAQAEAELKLTAAVLTYARHVQAGRFPFARISSANIELPQQPPETADVLTKLADARDVGREPCGRVSRLAIGEGDQDRGQSLREVRTDMRRQLLAGLAEQLPGWEAAYGAGRGGGVGERQPVDDVPGAGAPRHRLEAARELGSLAERGGRRRGDAGHGESGEQRKVDAHSRHTPPDVTRSHEPVSGCTALSRCA